LEGGWVLGEGRGLKEGKVRGGRGYGVERW